MAEMWPAEREKETNRVHNGWHDLYPCFLYFFSGGLGGVGLFFILFICVPHVSGEKTAHKSASIYFSNAFFWHAFMESSGTKPSPENVTVGKIKLKVKPFFMESRYGEKAHQNIALKLKRANEFQSIQHFWTSRKS